MFEIKGSFRTTKNKNKRSDKNQSGSHRLELRSCKNLMDEQSSYIGLLHPKAILFQHRGRKQTH